jgi:hypothetical protein
MTVQKLRSMRSSPGVVWMCITIKGSLLRQSIRSGNVYCYPFDNYRVVKIFNTIVITLMTIQWDMTTAGGVES